MSHDKNWKHVNVSKVRSIHLCYGCPAVTEWYLYLEEWYLIEFYFKLPSLSSPPVPPSKTYRYIYWQFQAYETIHRFENLQRQNNTIIHRISRVEDMLALTGDRAALYHGPDNILNNRRDRVSHTGRVQDTTLFCENIPAWLWRNVNNLLLILYIVLFFCWLKSKHWQLLSSSKIKHGKRHFNMFTQIFIPPPSRNSRSSQ